ncbi:MAG: hypothetical protein ACFFD4_09195 [Candidatus Odinarchaeota archaeon]
MSSESDCETVCCKEPCIDPCSEACGAACSEACNEACSNVCNEASCSEACNEACSNACNEACSNACSSSSGSGVSSVFTGMITISLVLLCSIIVGIIDAFNSQGPIVITLFGSVFLAVNLTGIRFVSNKNEKKICTSPCSKNKSTNMVSIRWGKILVAHSHHSLAQCKTGHEFRMGKKYFCTGCYGLFLGSVVAIAIFVTYLLDTVNYTFLTSYLFIIPLCFIPIIMRYTIKPRMGTRLKLAANGLIPIGCSLLFIAIDIIYQNWFINVGMVLFILLIAFSRGMVAARDNKNR